MAGTFQDRLITELLLAGATTIEQANRVLEQFLPRFNRRFQVPPQYPGPVFRPLNPELCLEQIRASCTAERLPKPESTEAMVAGVDTMHDG